MRLDSLTVKEISDYIANGESHPTSQDFKDLENYFGWANLIVNNESSGPFKFKSLAPYFNSNNKLTKNNYNQGLENINKLKSVVIKNSRLLS